MSEYFWTFLISMQWLCLLFFVGISIGNLVLCIISFFSLPKIIQSHTLLRELPQPHTNFEIPMSLIVTAYNEGSVIVESLRSLLNLDYPKYEIIVVNDGSSDNTIEILKKEFDLISLPLTIGQRLPHKPITEVYRSKSFPILRVINKENGGCKADASNAGIDTAVYSLISVLDADTILEPQTHKLLVQPFLEDPTTIAAGGAVKIVNGCDVSGGLLQRIGLAKHPLVLFQVLEYMRAFLFVRVGWAAVDALPIISGANGLFKREAIIEAGGFSRETHAEDLEIILRLHLKHLDEKKPYRIANVPDANCWTEAPSTYRVLRKQRVRWHQGFVECLWFNRRLLFHKRGGVLSWVSIPFQIIFEGLAPVIEIGGYLSTLILYLGGILSFEGLLAFYLLAVGSGILVTFAAMLLDEMTFQTYPKMRQILVLFCAAFIENIGYRQISAIWRFTGLIYWLTGYEESRQMARLASSWQSGSSDGNDFTSAAESAHAER